MNRIIYLAIIAVVQLVVLVSCNQPQVPEHEDESSPITIDEAKVSAFSEVSEYGLYNADVDPWLVMDKTQHELVYNRKSSRFVIQSDAQEALFTATLMPSDGESFYSVSISSKNIPDLNGTYTMKMVKSADYTAWLWEVGNNFGIVVLQ